MPANHEIKDEGMELVLNRVDWADAGTYRCEAVTPNMPSMTPVHQDFELTVECKYRPIPIIRDLFSNTNLYIAYTLRIYITKYYNNSKKNISCAYIFLPILPNSNIFLYASMPGTYCCPLENLIFSSTYMDEYGPSCRHGVKPPTLTNSSTYTCLISSSFALLYPRHEGHHCL